MRARWPSSELGFAVLHGLLGWALAAAAMYVADWKTRAPEASFSAHALVVPLAFLLVAFVYFRRTHALRPVVAGALFGAVVFSMDLFAIATLHRAADLRALFLGALVPACAAFVSAWTAGLASSVTSERARPH